MKHFFGFMLLLLVALADPALLSAATYRYIDGNGITCYADGLENVPSHYQTRAVIVVSKSNTAHTVAQKNRPGSHVPVVSENMTFRTDSATNVFRYNWLLLSGLLVSGYVFAHKIQNSGRIGLAFRIRGMSLIIVLALFIVFNRDIVSDIGAAVSGGYGKIRTEMKAQEERDKKPLKTLSEKVDEMMQQVRE